MIKFNTFEYIKGKQKCIPQNKSTQNCIRVFLFKVTEYGVGGFDSQLVFAWDTLSKRENKLRKHDYSLPSRY